MWLYSPDVSSPLLYQESRPSWRKWKAPIGLYWGQNQTLPAWHGRDQRKCVHLTAPSPLTMGTTGCLQGWEHSTELLQCRQWLKVSAVEERFFQTNPFLLWDIYFFSEETSELSHLQMHVQVSRGKFELILKLLKVYYYYFLMEKVTDVL